VRTVRPGVEGANCGATVEREHPALGQHASQAATALVSPLFSFLSPSSPERQLRERLEAKFGVELSDRKALIRAEVADHLAATTPAPAADEPAAADDEEDEEPAPAPAPKAKKGKKAAGGGGGGFAAMKRLSPEMAAFMGADTGSRTGIVKAVWAYIKAHDLQDPADRRKIRVEGDLASIFTPPITMFSMNKQIGKHLLDD
jgi:upstream activation factor subunit UAF30